MSTRDTCSPEAGRRDNVEISAEDACSPEGGSRDNVDISAEDACSPEGGSRDNVEISAGDACSPEGGSRDNVEISAEDACSLEGGSRDNVEISAEDACSPECSSRDNVEISTEDTCSQESVSRDNVQIFTGDTCSSQCGSRGNVEISTGDTAFAVREPSYEPSVVDEVSNVPTPHLSFIIQLLLPKHLISKEENMQAADVSQQLNSRLVNTQGMTAVPVGSVAECYALPTVISKKSGQILSAKLYSDTDVLTVWGIKRLYEYDSNSVDEQKLVLETEDSHSGYCRVRITDPNTVVHDDTAMASIFNSKYYLSSKRNRDLMMQSCQLGSQFAHRIQVDNKGPAIGMENFIEKTLKIFTGRMPLLKRQEVVPALPCRWPKCAMKWKERCQQSEWLKTIDIDKLIADGCHVVPVAHKRSNTPDIEWRISFATTEVELAKTLVSDDQRQCYVFFKLLRQITMKELNLISSYHCKTVFLYACERLPIFSWRENPGACCLHLIDRLNYHVQIRCLPSYFIPENNLFDNFTDAEFERMEGILYTTRKDPVGLIMRFTDEHIITGHSAVSSFRNQIKPVLDNFDRFRNGRNLLMSLPEFILATSLMFNSLLLDNNICQAATMLIDMFRFFETFYAMDDISAFFYNKVNNWQLVTQVTAVVEKVISFADKHPQLKTLTGHLALLYSTAALNFPHESKEYTEIIDKADTLYSSLLETGESANDATVDFANLLIRRGEDERARLLLQTFLQQEDAKLHLVNKYNRVTFQSLHEPIKLFLADSVKNPTNLVSIPSVALARYLHIVCQRNDEMKTRGMVEFLSYCKANENLWSFCLLGILYQTDEQFEEAEKAFSSANAIPISKSLADAIFFRPDVCHIQYLLKNGLSCEVTNYLLKQSQTKYPHMSLSDFINYLTLNMPSAEFSAAVYDEVVKDPAAEFEVKSMGNMAYMYHTSAYLLPEDSEEREVAIAKAFTLFQTALCTASKVSSAIFADYACFFCAEKKWVEGSMFLEENFDSFDDSSFNSFSTLEVNRLDSYMQSEVRLHGTITCLSKSLGYYCLSKCCFHTDKSKLSRVMAEFEHYCESSRNATSYCLLGYSNMMMENWAKAEHCFCKALCLCWTYTAAKQNIRVCRSKMEVKRPRKILQELYYPLCIIPEILGDFSQDFQVEM